MAKGAAAGGFVKQSIKISHCGRLLPTDVEDVRTNSRNESCNIGYAGNFATNYMFYNGLSEFFHRP